MTGYIPVGNGIGAAWLATGVLSVVSGPLFAQIERERRDGPRWVEAQRGGRALRRCRSHDPNGGPGSDQCMTCFGYFR